MLMDKNAQVRVWSEEELRKAECVWRAGAAPSDPAEEEGCCSCCGVFKSSCCFEDPEDQQVDIEVNPTSGAAMESINGWYVDGPT